MATWQFSVVLIPDSWAKENCYNSSKLYDEDGYYDTEYAWKNKQLMSGFESVLSEILPPGKSWHKDQLVWGNEKEHDIQVWPENGIIDGVHIRLDLHQNLSEIITKVVKVALKFDCALFVPEAKLIIEANEEELNCAISKSSASKFVANPRDFLGSISKET